MEKDAAIIVTNILQGKEVLKHTSNQNMEVSSMLVISVTPNLQATIILKHTS